MSVLDILTREHQLFAGLSQRLSAAADLDEASARREIRNILLLLLPALDKHEEIEDLVFGGPYSSEPGAEQVLKAVEVQHRRIEALREDLTAAMRDAERTPLPALRALVLELVKRLKEHMLLEETQLWPHFLHASGRSVSGSIARRAEESVKALEGDIRERQALIAEYLERPR